MYTRYFLGEIIKSESFLNGQQVFPNSIELNKIYQNINPDNLEAFVSNEKRLVFNKQKLDAKMKIAQQLGISEDNILILNVIATPTILSTNPDGTVNIYVQFQVNYITTTLDRNTETEPNHKPNPEPLYQYKNNHNKTTILRREYPKNSRGQLSHILNHLPREHCL